MNGPLALLFVTAGPSHHLATVVHFAEDGTARCVETVSRNNLIRCVREVQHRVPEVYMLAGQRGAALWKKHLKAEVHHVNPGLFWGKNLPEDWLNGHNRHLTSRSVAQNPECDPLSSETKLLPMATALWEACQHTLRPQARSWWAVHREVEARRAYAKAPSVYDLL